MVMAVAAAALRDEIMPKNILMIGPTGVGKTEIARRLSKLADAPFIKIEAISVEEKIASNCKNYFWKYIF